MLKVDYYRPQRRHNNFLFALIRYFQEFVQPTFWSKIIHFWHKLSCNIFFITVWIVARTCWNVLIAALPIICFHITLINQQMPLPLHAVIPPSVNPMDLMILKSIGTARILQQYFAIGLEWHQTSWWHQRPRKTKQPKICECILEYSILFCSRTTPKSLKHLSLFCFCNFFGGCRYFWANALCQSLTTKTDLHVPSAR